ncbi:MAG: GxxExxY protein [Planctomycetota bacterium]
MAEKDLKHSELTRAVIGAAMEVHSNLGPVFLESVYEAALAIELNLRNVPYERQKAIPVMYKGEKAKDFFCDFLVDRKVLVELKAMAVLTEVEEAQVLNYLKVTGLQVGLLVNFGQRSLKYKRLIQG